jgi:quercetin dioxygenase-like cupin family protein
MGLATLDGDGGIDRDAGADAWSRGAEAGACNPRHSHPNCDEVLYVLRGRLQHETGGEIVILEAGDTLAIPAGVAHQAVNIGTEEADTMVVYSSGRREFKLEPSGL